MTIGDRWCGATASAALLAIGCACGASPQRDAAWPAPIGARVYVTNEFSGDLSVVDVATRREIARLPLGKRPRGVRVSPDGGALYVALSGSPPAPPGVDESTLPPPDRSADGIGMVDLRSGRVTRMIAAGTDPEQSALTLDGRWLFVANEDAARASVIDLTAGAVVAQVPVGAEPEGVDVSPDGRVVYVTSEQDGEVFVIDVASRAVVARVPVGRRPRATAFLRGGRTAFVTAENDGALTIVDTVRHQAVGRIDLPGEEPRPMGVVAAPDDRTLFVTTGRGRTLVTIDVATLRPVRTTEVGARPWGVAVAGDGATVFTANGPSDDVAFVDAATGAVTARVPVGTRPWGVVYVDHSPGAAPR
jgi:YVTN family beta-propeller protein